MIGDMVSEEEDERQVELSSISAIFHEIVLDAHDPFSASIDLPVTPLFPLPVVFPESSDRPPLADTDWPRLPNTNKNEPQQGLESHLLSHLPSIHLQITLPEGYPATSPPIFQLSTSPQWLSSEILERLLSDGQRLWEEFGHDQVVFAYIDHLQQAAMEAFGVLGKNEHFQIPQDLKISLLDFDINAKRAAFEKETFDCGVCLDPKKGSACHRMLDCGHVFCVQCLQDFYNNAITEGDLVSVRCLAPDCAKKRGAIGESTAGKRRKPKTQISPSELLQIPLEYDMVKRYVTLKHKAELESDKTTVYCPRKWCQGAARSKKHRKPSQLLYDIVSSDDESEEEDKKPSKTGYKKMEDLLRVCEDCSFAFCSRCQHSWHGEFSPCSLKPDKDKITEEEKASLEYLKLHTTPCHTCDAPAQKTHGCNHMICFRCNTHFCYLCSAWLPPDNPYQHYNTITTPCYMRLWELEGGDGDDVGIGFAGGVQRREPVVHVEDDPLVAPIPADFEADPLPDDVLPAELVNEALQHEARDVVVPLAEPVAREGPLVLRIGQLPPRPVIPPVQPPPGAQARGPGRHPGAAAAAPAVRRRGNPPAPRAAVQRGLGRGGQDHAAAARDRAERAQALADRIIRHVEQDNVLGARLNGLGQNHPAMRRPAQPAAQPPAAGANGLGPDGIAWVQNFVQMALNDEEDLVDWDSDDEDEDEAWRIPVR